MDQNTTNLLTAFALLIIGVVTGGGGALLIIDHLITGVGKSPALIAFLQHLADSASPELLKTVHDGAIVLEKVTEPPAVTTTTSADGTTTTVTNANTAGSALR